MATIITEISKYLIIFFMVLYTIKMFYGAETGAGSTGSGKLFHPLTQHFI